MRRIALCSGLVALVLAGACREEGAAEKAGRKLDRAIDELTHPDEGALEKLGRQTDEALENVKEKLEGR
jgi:hypothetical protein